MQIAPRPTTPAKPAAPTRSTQPAASRPTKTAQAAAPRRPAGPTAPAVPASQSATAPDARAYQAAVARIRSYLSREDRLKAGTDPSGLRLQANAGSIFMPQPGPSAKGTVVLYHGYTAAPWQYQELAQKFYAAGYNVYAPRIVGHGLTTADGTATTRELPKAHERDKYEAFADERFEEAKALGGPVFMVGLSGGGNLALATAERHPEVKRVVACAPYLGPGDGWRFGTWALAALNTLTFGGLSWTLGGISRGTHSKPAADDPTPHTPTSLGNAWAIRSIGYRLKSAAVPTQFITTEGDFLSGGRNVANLLKRSKTAPQDGWYQFDKAEGVPHAMISRAENPVGASVDLIDRTALAFIETGKPLDHRPR